MFAVSHVGITSSRRSCSKSTSMSGGGSTPSPTVEALVVTMLYRGKRLPELTDDTALGARRARRSFRIRFPTLRIVGVLVCVTVSTARPQAPTGSPAALPEVVVETQRAAFRQSVAAFVKGVTKSPQASDEESLVRWNTPICFLAVGIGEEGGKAVLARLAEVASAAGAPLARQPCRANFVIVANSEPDRVIAAWYAQNSHLFGDATLAQIHRFLEGSQTRPVRIWRNIDRGRVAAMRLGHFVPSNLHAESSPFVRNAILGFFSVFAIVDTGRTEHFKLDQLADYVAMAGLANSDLDADLAGSRSILQLFAAPKETPPGLSSWDAAFLKALYQSDQTSSSQRFEIADRVMKELTR
jgi:hypothetical protein